MKIYRILNEGSRIGRALYAVQTVLVQGLNSYFAPNHQGYVVWITKVTESSDCFPGNSTNCSIKKERGKRTERQND